MLRSLASGFRASAVSLRGAPPPRPAVGRAAMALRSRSIQTGTKLFNPDTHDRGHTGFAEHDDLAHQAGHTGHTPQASSFAKPSHLLTLADLSPDQIAQVVRKALVYKHLVKGSGNPHLVSKSLEGHTIGMLFSKRSTRTRVATETSTARLGGHAMFLGSQDIQLGVNETLEDSARVIGSMVDGIMARVGAHEEVETLAKHSPVPVINALSALYHPTQILADIMALCEHFYPPQDLPTFSAWQAAEVESARAREPVTGRESTAVISPFRFRSSLGWTIKQQLSTSDLGLKGKKVAWVGDVNNITNEMLVTLPRLDMHVSVAAPKGYDQVDPAVWKRITDAGTEKKITLTNSPEEALHGADIVVTDTWISMGQEEEKAARLEAFKGFQLTNELIERSGANKDWVFLHCLPRKQEEVNDEVFYGPRSLVWGEAENRKWTIMSLLQYVLAAPSRNSHTLHNNSHKLHDDAVSPATPGTQHGY